MTYWRVAVAGAALALAAVAATPDLWVAVPASLFVLHIAVQARRRWRAHDQHKGPARG